jgi:hypothetical protein
VLAHRRSVLACYAALPREQLGAIDLKVLRSLSIEGMGLDETRAAQDTLRNIDDGARRELMASDNGAAIKRLMAAPRLSAKDSERLLKEEQEAAEDEARLAASRAAIQAHEKDEAAKSLLDQVRSMLNEQDDGGGTGAVAALDLLAGKRSEASALAYIGERMEEEGLVDTLLERLPPGSWFDTGAHGQTLVQLVQSRLPWKNARLIDDLLSYGLFDWAVRDEEALFAYRLIKLLPLSGQYRFRQRDAGKWYLRLLDNLPDGPALPGLEIRKADTAEDIAALKDQGITVDEKSMLFNASELYERKLKEKGSGGALRELIAAFQQAQQGVYRDDEAKDLYRRLVALGGSSLEPGRETPGDQVMREAVVHELDRLGYIDELFGELPEAFLFAEEHRVSTVKIMLARDPARVQAHARELLSRGATDWMVSDREAWLAYMCVKALPQDEREGFIAAHAELWGRIQAEMSAAQRQSRDLNAYIGDKAGTDRASVLGQLAEPGTWSAANLMLLDSLVRMAIAMTEHRFAFERSREFKAAGDQGLQPLVEKYRLWNPAAGRADYTPELLQGTRWHEEGVFASAKSLWHGAVALWNLDVLFIDHKVGAAVNLEHVQDYLGGDLMGAHLAPPGAQDKPAHPDANKLILLFGTDGKSAEVILPELLIDTANMQFGGSTLQTGQVRLKNLHLHAAYDGEDLGQPAQAHAELGSLEARDLLLASSSSMIAVSRLVLQTLRLAAGTIDTVTGGHKGERKGRYVPFPLLVLPLLGLFMLLALPVYLYRKIAGLVNQGMETSATQRIAGDLAQRTKAIDFSFSSLSAEGLATSGGQQVAKVAVSDVALRVGLNKATRLRAERASIDQRLAQLHGKPEGAEASARLSERRAAIDAALVQAGQEEKEYLEIQRRILKGGLGEAEQDTLQARLDALKFEESGSAYIDIGSVEASGIAGPVTSKEAIRLSGIHGEGGGAALTDLFAAPTVTDRELSRRAAAGERPGAPLENQQEGKVTLELGDVHTGELTFAGGIRTVAEIDKKLAELEKVKAVPEIAPLYDSLLLLRPKAARYALLVQHGLSALTPAQLQEFRELRQVLAAKASLVIKSIDVTRLRLDIDVASGKVAAGADMARLTGIQLPSQGIEIDQLIARGLGVGALPAGGLLDWADWKKNLQDANASVDSLEVSGVRDKYHGLLFEKATLTGAYAGFKARGNLVEAGLKRFTAEGVGIVPRIGLLRQRLASLEHSPERAAEAAALRSKIAELQQLADARVAAYRQLEQAATPEQVAAAKQAVSETDTAIILGLAQGGAARIDIEDFGLSASGAGDVLGDVLGGDFDPDRISRSGGVHLKSHLRRFAVSGGNVRTAAKDETTVGGANVELGETSIDVGLSRDGDKASIDLADFRIASFALSQMLLTSDEGGLGQQIGSTGTSSIEGVRLAGRLLLEKRSDVKGEGAARFPADFRVAHADISEFRIDKVSANGLLYSSIPERMQVSIKSGAIRGIWARDLHIDFPASGKDQLGITGAAGVDAISDVDVAASVAGGWELAHGRINSKGLQFKFMEEGEIEASAESLAATAVALRGPDGWTRISMDSFRTGKIASRLKLEKDAVTLHALDVDKVAIGHTTYRGAGGMKVGLDGAGIGHIGISGVRVALQPAKDEKGKDTRKVSHISVKEIRLTDIHADRFSYSGKSASLNDKHETVVDDTTITAEKAWIDRLTISDVKHDLAAGLTTLTAAIDNRDAGKPAFGVDELVANIVTRVGSKESAIRIATDVEGSALTGTDISFQSIPRGKAPGPGGHYEPVPRTAIGGKFQLTELAFLHPEVVLTDEKHRQTTIRTTGTGAGQGKLVFHGVNPVLHPDGTMVVPIDSIKGDQFLIERDGIKVTVPLIELKDFALARRGDESLPGMQRLAAKVKELSVQGLTMEMKVDRSAGGAGAEPGVAGPAFFAEPVEELSGELQAGSAEHSWVPHFVTPIHHGKLDFEHVHPVAINLRDGKITLGNFRKIELDVTSIPKTPGMHPEQGKYGVIDFREMLEGILNAPPAAPGPAGKAEPPADLSWLDKVAVGGRLKLGRGKIGIDSDGSGKASEGDTFAELDDQQAGDNTLQIPFQNAGKEVDIHIARLRAKRLAIAGNKNIPAGKTGEATVTGIRINVSGLARMAFTIHVYVKEGKIVDIAFGDLSVFEQYGPGAKT